MINRVATISAPLKRFPCNSALLQMINNHLPANNHLPTNHLPPLRGVLLLSRRRNVLDYTMFPVLYNESLKRFIFTSRLILRGTDKSPPAPGGVFSPKARKAKTGWYNVGVSYK